MFYKLCTVSRLLRMMLWSTGKAAVGRPGDADEAVRTLCGLLAALLDSPALRQSALIVLAVNAELVPRLWFSYLKVTPMTPMTSHAFHHYLLTNSLTHLEH